MTLKRFNWNNHPAGIKTPQEKQNNENCVDFLGVLPDWKPRLTNIKKTSTTWCLIVGLLHHITSFRAHGASVSDRLAMMVHMVTVQSGIKQLQYQELSSRQFVDHCWVPSDTVWPLLVPDVSPALVCVVRRDMEGYFLCEPAQTHSKQSQISI